MPEKEIVYKGKIFNVTHESVIDEDGTKHLIEKCSRPDVVTVIGLQEQQVLLINEFRSGSRKHVYWLPGGKVDEGELPKEAAKREFEEETRHSSQEYELFHTKYPSDTFTGNGYAFLAKNIKPAENIYTTPDEVGKISTELIDIDEAINMTFEGIMPNEFFGYLLIKIRRDLFG